MTALIPSRYVVEGLESLFGIGDNLSDFIFEL